MLKPLLFVSAVVIFGITASSTPRPMPQDTASDATAGQKNPVKPTDKSQARAQNIYAQDCAICHGDNGNGKTDLAQGLDAKLGDWTDPKTLADQPDQTLFNTIRKGKNKMPAEDVGRAKDDEVWNLILYIRGLSKGQRAATPAATPQPAPAPATN
jgi:mono/diheme cytochrome c family protein